MKPRPISTIINPLDSKNNRAQLINDYVKFGKAPSSFVNPESC